MPAIYIRTDDKRIEALKEIASKNGLSLNKFMVSLIDSRIKIEQEYNDFPDYYKDKDIYKDYKDYIDGTS